MSSIFQKPPFNYQYFVGLENAADYEDAGVTISGVVGETAFHTLSLVANGMARSGQRIRALALGSETIVAGVATFRVRVNGALVFSKALQINGTLRGWRSNTELFRRGASLFSISDHFDNMAIAPIIAGAVSLTGNYFELVNFDFTQQIDIAFSLQSDNAANSVTFEYASLNIL